MDLRSNLLAEADRYCEAAKISKARLATIVAKDGKFFTRLDAGGDCTLSMYERFMKFFSAANTTTPAAENQSPISDTTEGLVKGEAA